MKYKVLSEEVLYSEDRYPYVTGADLDTLVELAAETKRKRIRLCTHSDGDSKLQEMFIVHEKSAYVRPHKHTDKDECLHVHRGRADMIFFDGEGAVTDVIALGEISGPDAFSCRVPAGAYHMLIIRSDVLVFSEATTGPFDRDNMIFADWAPEAEMPESWEYVAEISARIDKGETQ
ncbi:MULTISPECIES: WbuC family cupin fold metalloprotein [unclassified Pseudodesulfovibrio]|uniref:WbuC family cupin fold metalloprotein n=1 Tax=unclassified Pseudodesulfovibrio TaxID=2661612 RepID=UPI000FEBB56F|nr:MULTISPECIES: WbuC family cupin fold metalloprotein [unclassified Pseudodesulfovibrio]MCJ2164134.1 WbuC family cupin fold metalloprotein [Pseudodesulfovibrio sp. S3-i]RWU05237.1 cupin fold metalloprotein, WbuC family [Pseudodesulfovibrio sp. S3]